MAFWQVMESCFKDNDYQDLCILKMTELELIPGLYS
jgi:hypothetical protein